MIKFILYCITILPLMASYDEAKLFEYALKNSLDLQISHNNIKSQEVSIKQAELDYDFIVNFSSSLDVDNKADASFLNGSLDLDNTVISTLSVDKKLKSGFSIGASVSSDFFNNDHRSNSASITISKALIGKGSSFKDNDRRLFVAKSNTLQRKNSHNLQVRRIRHRVKVSYYNLLNDIRQLEIRKRGLQAAEKTLESAKIKGAPLDISNAEISRDERQLAIIEAKANLQEAKQSLKLLIGMPLDEKLEIKANDNFFKEEIFNEEELYNYAIENHEEIINAKLQRELLKYNLEVNKANLGGRLSVEYRHNFSNKPNSFNLSGDERNSLSLNFDWPLGLTSEHLSLEASEYNLLNDQLEFKQLLRNKKNNISNILRRLKSSLARIKIQKSRIEISKKRLELFKIKWENGEIDNLEYVRSQNAYEEDLFSLDNLKNRYMQDKSNLLLEIGR